MSTYSKSNAKIAYKLRLLGATYKQVAEFFEITERKLHVWMRKYPAFKESMRTGGELADANVAKSLYRRACGYSHPEDKIFAYKGEVLVAPTVKHYAPDTTAAVFWLQTRQRDRWRKDNDSADKDKPINFNVFTANPKDVKGLAANTPPTNPTNPTNLNNQTDTTDPLE